MTLKIVSFSVPMSLRSSGLSPWGDIWRRTNSVGARPRGSLSSTGLSRAMAGGEGRGQEFGSSCEMRFEETRRNFRMDFYKSKSSTPLP